MIVLSNRVQILNEELELSNGEIEESYRHKLALEIAEKIVERSVETHKGPGGKVLEIRQILISQWDLYRLLQKEYIDGVKSGGKPKDREILTNHGRVTISQ